jgi:hypothetical protein
MIVPLILDPLLKLIDKGVEFLREGERQKKLFFEEVIQPLEDAFEELYAAHIATFKQTRKMLLSSKSANEIASFVEGRILFEQGTTELLLRLTRFDEEQDWRRVPTNNLAQEFSAYVASIARCLISPDVSPRPTVAYYLAGSAASETEKQRIWRASSG